MNKRLLPKFKFDRRISENIWNTAKSSYNRKQNAPGQHGTKSKSILSDYCIRLLAKQKLKFYYSNLTESKFKKVYIKALNYKGNVSHNLVRLLELRLDVLVYRVGLVPSFRAARQLINHGHILVNNKKVNICSFECSIGDIFRVIPNFVNSLIIKQSLLNSKYYSLNYIKANYKYLTFELISIPKIEEIAYLTSMCPELVIEHYSGRN
ncbi:MAG: 30S ribosomal protein S4 [Candidatus Hodgkinia cicadicola]